MSSTRRGILIAIVVTTFRASLLAYGPTGHEIVGGIADKLIANTPAAKKVSTLIDGITLERASIIADEIKAWTKTVSTIQERSRITPTIGRSTNSFEISGGRIRQRRIRNHRFHRTIGFTTPMCQFSTSTGTPTA